MTQPFIKTGGAAQNRWEVLGLNWLAAAEGAPVVKVLDWDAKQLVEERLTPINATPRAAEEFGRGLARTHAAGAEAFGVGPQGWDDSRPGWIGRACLPLGRYARWGEFYAELRVLPHAHAAHARGTLSSAGLGVIERVCQRLRDGEFDDARPPARIHGDLWGGNVIASGRGMVMIDPAAHAGHGETDLAMLALFGFPYLRRVQDAYAEAAGLDPGWPTRIRLHQLHPLLVHAELFGSHYGLEAVEVASSHA